MSETGATPAQIGAAKMRNFEANCADPDSNVMQFAYFGPGNRMDQMASYLVPPDHRIIGPEDVELLRRYFDAAHDAGFYVGVDDELRIAALLKDDR